ncbi:MAG: PPC domain-containing protein [Spirochaetaceae bacterium]|jgi:hypothetical protein|nr:PPC domain-containing protein [Spirochaetaceae bacterium]
MKRPILTALIVWFLSLPLAAQSGDAYEPNDIASGAYPLSPGRFNMNFTSGDEDWFSFRLTSQATIRVSTEGSLDTRLNLYGPNSSSEEISSDDDGGDDLNARISVYLREPGLYYIHAYPYDEETTGSYVLVLEMVNPTADSQEPNNRRDQARTVSLSRLPLALSLFPDDDADWFKIDLSGFQYRTGEVINLYTSGDLDTYLELYQGDILIQKDDDGADDNSSNARIVFLPERGVSDYYIKIRGYDNSVTGEYIFHGETSIEEFDQYEPNNTRAQAARISVGQTLSGNALSNYDPLDWFIFTISQAGTYIIGTTGSLDTVIVLYDSSGAIELDSDDDGGRDNNALIESYLERGTYYAKVTQYGGNYGEYSFYLRQR